MNASNLSIIAVLVLCCVHPRLQAQDWTPLGPNDWNWPSVGKAYSPRLAVDGNGFPVVASRDYGEGGGWVVRQWDGAKWNALGTSGFFPDGALLSEMVIDEFGNPVLAGSDPDNDDHLQVRRWNGSMWTAVGMDGLSSGAITAVRMKKASNGALIVAFIDASLDQRVVVKRWTGTGWELIGEEGFSDADAGGLCLALDGEGNPLVAYKTSLGVHLTRVQRWTGTTWETMPPIDLGIGTVSGLDIGVDPAGQPFAILAHTVFGSKATVVGWNGGAWETIGPAGFSVGSISDADLEFDSEGQLVVLFRDNDEGTSVRLWSGTSWEVLCTVDPLLSPQHPKMDLRSNGDIILACQSWGLGWRAHVQRWNGAAWSGFGDRGFSALGAYYTSLATQGNEVVVAYSDMSIGNRTTVQRWNGGEWELIGPVGISSGHAGHHSLAMDPLGFPVVAFADNANGGATVMRWDGVAWEPIGPLGFTGVVPAGISMSLTASGRPVVAYKIYSGVENFYRIAVMSWDGFSWNEIGEFPTGQGMDEMRMALDPAGYPVVGYNRASIGGSRVVRWDGTEWNTLPGVPEAGWPYFQDLVLDMDGRPILASSGTLYRWNGSSWVVIGSGGDVEMGSVCLEVSGTNEILAGGLVDGRATVRRWSNGSWKNMGSERFTTSFSDFNGPRWLRKAGVGKVVIAYTNGGMYAKSIEYSDLEVGGSSGEFTLGPNPISGQELWMGLGGLPWTTESVKARLHDVSGREVFSQVLPVVNGNLNAVMHLPPFLASGTYVASVSADGSRWSAKVFIARP